MHIKLGELLRVTSGARHGKPGGRSDEGAPGMDDLVNQ